MKSTLYIILTLIVTSLKAICVMLAWNYVIMDMISFKSISIYQALLGALCWWIITTRVRIKDGRKC